MKNRIVLILPYFGKLPNYFDLWMYTASRNVDIDFLIFTDNYIEIKYDNVFVETLSFKNFKAYFDGIFEFPSVLNSPYKLCDYRPVFGNALQNYIKDYEFWGHCDSDVLFGKLNHFITNEILDNYDRIYTRGHLTIYRNTENMNNLYLLQHTYRDCFSYHYVYSTDFSCAYDEWGTKYGYGLSEIIKRKKISNYDSMDIADVYPQYYEFVLDDGKQSKIDYFAFKNDILYGYFGNQKREFAYVHLQKRNLNHTTDDQCNSEFYIYPNSIVNKKNEYKINEDEENEFYKNYRKNKLITKYNKIRKGALMQLADRMFGRINKFGDNA